jgi:cytoskeletal protein CcmA (bactofilin family)
MTFQKNPNSRVSPTTSSPRPDFTTADSGSPAEPESSVLSNREDYRQTYASERQTKQGAVAPEECANILARGSKWQGSVVVEDSIRIEGGFKGELDSKGTVQIVGGGAVDANAEAAFVVISGSFTGLVTCLERLELQSKSKTQGEILTKSLTVQEGALVDANIRMSTDRPRTASKDL